MPAEKSKLPKEQNLPKEKDELSSDSTSEAIENAKKEIEHFEQNLVSIQEGKERFTKMWERDERLYNIMINNHRKLEPVYEYEKLEEYWEIRKQQLVDKYEEDKFVSEQKIKQYDMQLEQVKEQLESTKEMLADLEGD